MRILIADDNRDILKNISDNLSKKGFLVECVTNGKEALEILNKQDFDLVILDILMPVLNGIDACKEIRKTSNIPIIILSALSDDSDKVLGLDIGADDYIVKPFSISELEARIKSILRRINSEYSNTKNSISLNNLKINLNSYIVTYDEIELSLTKKEIELLWYFIINKDIVLSREQLLDEIWGLDYDGDMRTVDTHIKRLRAKLNKNNVKDISIDTIWGVGYIMRENTNV